MLQEIKRQSIIAAIQRTRDFCCPGCGSILDVRRAVEVNFSLDGSFVHSSVSCGTCWDKVDQPSLLEDLSRRLDGTVTLETYDGRAL